MRRYVLGAYAAAPSQDGWNEELESEYFARLRDETLLEGLELQFTGTLHQDPSWLLRNLRPDWSFVLTTIGGTMGLGKTDPAFGIASDDAPGRQRALDYLAKARDAVKLINDWAGRRAVRAVEVHSAPRSGAAFSASQDSLRLSLSELRDWNWEGAELSIEHCDALVAGQAPDKGFLPLHTEIKAIQECAGQTPIGIALNWGRSAIEARNPDEPRKHLEQMLDSGHLRGLMFSGVTFGDPQFADWADRHAPFSDANNANQRLLTAARLEECMSATRRTSLAFLGVKISTAPKGLPPVERVAEIRRCLTMLDHAVQKTNERAAA